MAPADFDLRLDFSTGVAIDWLKNGSSESSNSLGAQNDRFLPTVDDTDDRDDAIVVEAITEPSVVISSDSASTWMSGKTVRESLWGSSRAARKFVEM
ncbi:hypothetical protein K0M31_005978 [Melipona bicolor]|uniref:Uncharacterized protein n=1 Tax=Melipona bicolor TaxID=60889 RepID=A0AA40FSL0_9HYME|nr:hypothetical protein K0M31_005978 [Melipona bicolor]